MPNMSIYVPDEIAAALARWPEINRSKVCADALRLAVRAKERELVERGPVKTTIVRKVGDANDD